MLGGADQRGLDELQDGALAKGMRDHLGAPARLTEQPLEQIGTLTVRPHGVRCSPAPTRGVGSSFRTWNTPPAVEGRLSASSSVT